MSFINNLGISSRLYLAFGVIAAIIVAMGAKTIWTTTSLDSDFNKFAHEGEVLVGVAHITRSFMEMHASAETYFVAPDQKAFKEAKAAHDKLLVEIDAELPKLTVPEKAEKMKEARHLVEEYWNGFVELAKDRREQKKIYNTTLKDTGETLRKELLELYKHVREEEVAADQPGDALDIISDAMIHLLIARDDASRFVYGHDKAALDHAYKEIERVRKDLVADPVKRLSAKDQALIKKAVKHLDEYHAALKHYAKLEKHAKELHDTIMVKDKDKILADMDAIEKLAIEKEHKIGKHVHAEAAQAITLSVLALILAVVAAGALSFVLGRMISRPVNGVAETMHALSEGRLDTKMPEVKGKNEIAEMISALRVFRENMQKRVEMQTQQAKDQELKSRRQDEVNQLVGIFGSTIRGVFDRVSSSSETMSQTALELSNSASSASDQAAVLNDEANETARAVTTVSSAAEELSASIGEIQRRVDHSADISNKAIECAQETSDSFSQLLEASQQITSVVALIQEIAEQTNLLALNATIEAARAGEAGKGFAVVASEVKELATQTAKATGDISEQVGAVQRTAKEAETNMATINTTIAEINDVASSIASAVSEQQVATNEIAQSVEVVAASARKVGESVAVVSGSADQSRDGATGVKAGADDVAQEARVLSTEVETFLGALGNQDDEDTFQIYDVNFSAGIDVGGKSYNGTVTRISSAAATVSVPVDAAPGTQLTVAMDGFPEPISGRLAACDGSESQIQFPLNLEHVAVMRDQIAQAIMRKAA